MKPAMTTNVLVLETHAEAYAQELRSHFPQLSVHAAKSAADVKLPLASVDVLIAFGIAINDGLIASMTGLKWIQSLATGVDHFLNCKSLRDETLLTSARGIHGPAMRETVAYFMLSLARDTARLVRNQAAHNWDRSKPWPLLFGKTAVVVGIGVGGIAIGQLLQAFGMHVTGISRTPRTIAGFDEVVSHDKLVAAVGKADYVINILPGSAANAGAFGKDVFQAMKRGSYFINVGRGETVDEPALIDALRDGRIAGAGLDVFSAEPLAKDSALWDMPNVIVSPHIGGFFIEYEELVMPLIVGNMKHFLAGHPTELSNLIERKKP